MRAKADRPSSAGPTWTNRSTARAEGELWSRVLYTSLRLSIGGDMSRGSLTKLLAAMAILPTIAIAASSSVALAGTTSNQVIMNGPDNCTPLETQALFGLGNEPE